jgi:hypothetical protein
MITTKTRTEMVLEAAIKLKIVGTGQSLDADYNDRLDRNVDPLFMQLANDGICEVVNDQQIPSEWFDSLAGLLANVSASVGGANFDPQIKQFYEMMLRRITAKGPQFTVQETEYF